jgi:hypothetical protein
MNLQLAGDNVQIYREAAAERIKQLMQNWTENTLTLAAELAQVAETFPINPRRPDERPGFAKWAVQKTGLSRGQISSLLQIHRKFGARGRKHQLASQVMKLLVQQDIPESARQEIVDRSERGERIGLGEAKKIADRHKLPGPKAANEQAKEEGRPVLASDGYIYFGTDPRLAKEGADRRSMVYGVRRALDHLGNIQLTGKQFLDYAFPHQLWTSEEEAIIKKALRWLSDLDQAWDKRA